MKAAISNIAGNLLYPPEWPMGNLPADVRSGYFSHLLCNEIAGACDPALFAQLTTQLRSPLLKGMQPGGMKQGAPHHNYWTGCIRLQ